PRRARAPRRGPRPRTAAPGPPRRPARGAPPPRGDSSRCSSPRRAAAPRRRDRTVTLGHARPELVSRDRRDRGSPGVRCGKRRFRAATASRLVEQPQHLRVVHLPEGGVVGADGEERFGRLQADDGVGFAADQLHARRRPDGDRGDDAGGAGGARPAQRGDHRRAGREPVVDDDDRPGAEVQRRMAGMQPLVEQRRLRLRLLHGRGHLLLGEPVGAAHVDAVAGRDRADSVLRLPRVSDLAHGDDVELRLERARDLGCRLDPAAREPDDGHPRPALAHERRRERPARVPPVGEQRFRSERELGHLEPRGGVPGTRSGLAPVIVLGDLSLPLAIEAILRDLPSRCIGEAADPGAGNPLTTARTASAGPRMRSRPAAGTVLTMSTLAALWSRALAQAPATPAFLAQEAGAWREVGWEEAGRSVDELAAGFLTLGIGPGERVAILSRTRLEWTLCDWALIAIGALPVPLYPTSSALECSYVLGNCGARMVVCEDAEQEAKVAPVRRELEALERLILIDGDGGPETLRLAELRARGRALLAAKPHALEGVRSEIGEDDPLTIVYTSGTTGPPKGCLLTNRNYASMVEMVRRVEGLIEPGDRVLLHLPLAHTFARLVEFLGAAAHMTIGFCPDAAGIPRALREVRPTILPSVPRLYEKLAAAIRAGIGERRAPGRALARWALDAGARAGACREQGLRLPPRLAVELAVADRLVLGRVRARL